MDNKYKILYSDEALLDLENIENYIVYHLKNPDAAWDTINGILDTVDKLDIYPKEHPLVLDSYLAKLGVRLCFYKNYNMLYIVSDPGEVYIVRVFYNRRDWINLLKNNNLTTIK